MCSNVCAEGSQLSSKLKSVGYRVPQIHGGAGKLAQRSKRDLSAASSEKKRSSPLADTLGLDTNLDKRLYLRQYIKRGAIKQDASPPSSYPHGEGSACLQRCENRLLSIGGANGGNRSLLRQREGALRGGRIEVAGSYGSCVRMPLLHPADFALVSLLPVCRFL